MINIYEVNETNKMIEKENLDVRTGKNTTVGSTSLVMAGYIDKHVEESRVEGSVAHSDEGSREVISYRMVNAYEEKESHKRDAHTFGSILS